MKQKLVYDLAASKAVDSQARREYPGSGSCELSYRRWSWQAGPNADLIESRHASRPGN